MLVITNRILEKSSKFTHTQIKRWAVAFLRPDKSSGQHSGVSRTYDFEQASRIYFGGYLVQDLKFTLDEAKQILNDIYDWLDEKGWNLSDWVHFRQSKLGSGYVADINFPWLDLFIDIGIGSNKAFFYRAKIVHTKKLKKEPNRWAEEYDIEDFGKLSPISTVPLRNIDIRGVISSLAFSIAQAMRE